MAPTVVHKDGTMVEVFLNGQNMVWHLTVMYMFPQLAPRNGGRQTMLPLWVWELGVCLWQF